MKSISHSLIATCIIILLSCCICSWIKQVSAANVLTTIAGGGLCDNGPASSAIVNGPTACVVDSLGQLYISEGSGNRIRKVDVNGVISTIVGTGEIAFNGDGLAALDTNIDAPAGLAYQESSKELYFSASSLIRKVLANGTVVIVAGMKDPGFVDNVEATKGKLGRPSDIALYPNGDFLIADFSSYTIRKVSNGTITTFAGSTLVGINTDPEGINPKSAHIMSRSVTISPSGEVYLTDNSKAKLRVVKLDGKMYTIPGTDYSNSIRLNSIGEIMYTKENQHTIYKISKDGNSTKIAGTGVADYNGDNIPATSASLFKPVICIDPRNDEVLVADTVKNRVRRILTNGTIITISGNGEIASCDGIASSTAINKPMNLITDPVTGDILIVESNGCKIKLLSNGIISTLVGTGESGLLDNVASSSAMMSSPYDIAFTNDGFVIADSNNHRIRKVSNGVITTIAGINHGYNGDSILANNSLLAYPKGVSVDLNTNEIYIADKDNNRIRKILTNGTIITIAGDGQGRFQGDHSLATSASLNHPEGVTFDPITNETYIADTGNDRIRKILTNGTIITVAGNGQQTYTGDGLLASNNGIYQPNRILLDPLHGEIYIVAMGMSRVFKILRNGKMYTVAGHGNSAYNGNNLDPLSSGIGPGGVTLSLDASTLIISDFANSMLRSMKIIRCNGTSPEYENVCSGHGSCIDQDVCSCNVGYNGTFCDEIPCFGSLGKKGCSERGECIAVDKCSCNSGWTGLDCSMTTCFGIPSNDSNVCNGNGNCVNLDSCECKDAWSGLNCSQTVDNSTNITNVDNSTTIGNNTVSSTTLDNNTVKNDTVNPTVNNQTNITNVDNSTITGNDTTQHINPSINNQTNTTNVNNSTGNNTTTTQHITCFGVAVDSANTCSGSGKCISLDNCSCNQGYQGSNCESLIQANITINPIAIITAVSIISPCDTSLVLNASKSNSPDGNPIQFYYWSIISSPNNSLKLNFTSQSTITINSQSLQLPGEYKFGLTIESNGKLSNLTTWTVTKSTGVCRNPSSVSDDGGATLGIILGTVLGSTCLMISCLIVLVIGFKVFASVRSKKSKESNSSIEMSSGNTVNV